MRQILLCGAALVLLAGCNKAEDSPAASDKVVRAPGAWKTSMELTKFSMPGAPKEAEEMMRGMMSKLQDLQTCLTPEAAAKEDIASALAKPPGGGGECSFTKKDVAGSDIDVTLSCKDPSSPEPVTITMKGKAEAKKTDMVLTVSGKQAGQDINMEMHAVNQWVGECTGKEKAAS